MSKTSRSFRLLNRACWLAVTKACFAMVALVFAASITVTSSTYQAEVGSAVNVVSGFLAIDKGFSLTATSLAGNGTSCLSPVTFSSSPGTANTNLAARDLVYDVQVNWTSAPTSTRFNVTLVLASTTYGPLCIQTPSQPGYGEIIECKFDVGSSLPASPYSFTITVR